MRRAASLLVCIAAFIAPGAVRADGRDWYARWHAPSDAFLVVVVVGAGN